MYLTEIWADQAALDAHGRTEHYAKPAGLKAEYVLDTQIEKMPYAHGAQNF